MRGRPRLGGAAVGAPAQPLGLGDLRGERLLPDGTRWGALARVRRRARVGGTHRRQQSWGRCQFLHVSVGIRWPCAQRRGGASARTRRDADPVARRERLGGRSVLGRACHRARCGRGVPRGRARRGRARCVVRAAHPASEPRRALPVVSKRGRVLARSVRLHAGVRRTPVDAHSPRARRRARSRPRPLRQLEAKVARLEKELTTAHTILEVQEVAGLLGFSLNDGKDC